MLGRKGIRGFPQIDDQVVSHPPGNPCLIYGKHDIGHPCNVSPFLPFKTAMGNVEGFKYLRGLQRRDRYQADRPIQNLFRVQPQADTLFMMGLHAHPLFTGKEFPASHVKNLPKDPVRRDKASLGKDIQVTQVVDKVPHQGLGKDPLVHVTLRKGRYLEHPFQGRSQPYPLQADGMRPNSLPHREQGERPLETFRCPMGQGPPDSPEKYSG